MRTKLRRSSQLSLSLQFSLLTIQLAGKDVCSAKKIFAKRDRSPTSSWELVIDVVRGSTVISQRKSYSRWNSTEKRGRIVPLPSRLLSSRSIVGEKKGRKTEGNTFLLLLKRTLRRNPLCITSKHHGKEFQGRDGITELCRWWENTGSI